MGSDRPGPHREQRVVIPINGLNRAAYRPTDGRANGNREANDRGCHDRKTHVADP